MGTKPPLQLRWRIPQGLPPDGGEVEVAWCRFLDQQIRMTIAPVERRGLVGPHPLAPGTMVPLVGRGWEVRIDGEPMTGDNLTDFWDACYNAWAAFVEIIPTVAKTLTQALDQRSIREQWDRARMEVYADYAWNEDNLPAGVPGGTDIPPPETPVGRDTGG